MQEHITEQLSAYLDGDLAPAESAAVETHLAECAGCRATLEELRRIVSMAASLEPREPARDLWPEIAAKMQQAEPAVLPLRRPEGTARRFSFSGPQLAAAATLLALISGGSVWWLQQRTGNSTIAAVDTAATPAGSAVQFVASTEYHYDPAIRELEQELAARRDQLDSATVATVENSLRVIDAAIDDARAALQRDPSNAFLFRRLDDNMMRKIDLLRRATTLRRAT
jgi:hypothetical protein